MFPRSDGFKPRRDGSEGQHSVADDEDGTGVDGKENRHQQQTGCVEERVEKVSWEDEMANTGKELQEASTHLPRYMMHSIPISSHETDVLELVDVIDREAGT